MLYRVQGIVIRSMDYGEGNKIVTLFTKEAGKTTVMVRGARKIKSRHSAVAQMFTEGEYVFFKSGAGSMGTLNHGEIEISHSRLREDLALAAYAAYAAELIDRTVEDGEANPFLYEQLKACLQAWEDGKLPGIVSHLLELKVLAAAGYEPVLEQCASCGRDWEGDGWLSPPAGGLLCGSCRLNDPQSLPLSASTRKLFLLLKRLDARRLGTIQVKDETQVSLKAAIRRWMDHYLDIRLKSRAFLDSMDGWFDT